MLGAAMGGGDANTKRAHNIIKDVADADKDEQKAERSDDTDAQLQALGAGSFIEGATR